MPLKLASAVKPKLALAITLLAASTSGAISINEAWINEINYDEPGADTGEFVEIAGLAGTNLGSLALEFYNGNGGASYKTISLGGVLGDAGNGYGFASFAISGIENGSPDGIALVFGASVLQFISYEGPMTAADGAASGQSSTDIGVSETNSTPANQTLQFLGHANSGAWTGPIASTSGALNTGQILPELRSKSDPVPDSSATIKLLGIGLAASLVLKRRLL